MRYFDLGEHTITLGSKSVLAEIPKLGAEWKVVWTKISFLSQNHFPL